MGYIGPICVVGIVTNKNKHQLCKVIHVYEFGGGGGDSPIKEAGMLIVSLRVVNFRFSSHLGFSWQNAMIFNRKGLF